MTSAQILRRCHEAPEQHLAEPSMAQFQAYECGYWIGSGYELTAGFDGQAIEQAILADYQLESRWPQDVNFQGFLSAAEGQPGALGKYLEYLERFPSTAAPTGESPWQLDLFQVLGLDAFRKRPAMYLGNDASAAHLWSMVSGACWAERDRGGAESRACDFMADFQAWAEARLPFSRGIPWHRTFLCLCLGSSDRSLQTSFDNFDLFLRGEAADMSQAQLAEMAKAVAPI